MVPSFDLMKANQPDKTRLLIRLSPVRWYHKLMHKGDRVRCNVCGQNFRKFRSFGVPLRANAMCPNCYSLETTRVLWFYLSDEVLGKKNKNNFLYFEPESFLLDKISDSTTLLQSTDLSYLNSLTEMEADQKLPGGKADVIIFSHVLEYARDEEAVFEELKRLLRPGGFVLIQTIVNWEMDRSYENPSTWEDKDRLNLYFTPGVERIYGADIVKHLVKAGFDVEQIDYADQLGSAAKKYYSLGDGKREMIFKCKKLN